MSEDAGPAGGLGGVRLRAAEHSCLAATTLVHAGTWTPEADADLLAGIGLLLLEGFVLLRVGARGRYGAQVLGPGDLLRPWELRGCEASLPYAASLQAIAPSRLALLDRRFAVQAGRFPEVTGALVGRRPRDRGTSRSTWRSSIPRASTSGC